MSDTTTRPSTMARPNSIDGAEDGRLIINITDPSHLLDVLAFARDQGREKEFIGAFIRLIGSSVEMAAPRPPLVVGEGADRQEYPGRPARVVELELSPDFQTPNQPDLGWRRFTGGRVETVGGVVWDRHSGTWGIHT